MMKVLRLVSENWDDSIELLEIEQNLPKRHCATCQSFSVPCVASDVPERPTAALLNLLSPYLQDYPHDLLVAMDQATDEENWDDPIWAVVEAYNSISVEEFANLAERIRAHLQLSSNRLVLPVARIGPLRVHLPRPLTCDIMGGGAECVILLSGGAATLLTDSSLRGFQIFPVDNGDRSDWVYEMIVFGEGGLPITTPDGYWEQCKECGEWWLQKDQPYVFEVDLNVWDKSDFFHFAGKGDVYVSERAKEWLETSGLRLGIGFVEPAQDAYGYRAFLSKNVHETAP